MGFCVLVVTACQSPTPTRYVLPYAVGTLGITRDEVIDLFSDFDFNFVVGEPVNDSPAVVGQPPEKKTGLLLIGERSSLEKIVLIFLWGDNIDPLPYSTYIAQETYATALLAKYVPDALQWYLATAPVADEKYRHMDVQRVFDGRRVRLWTLDPPKRGLRITIDRWR